MYLQVRKRIDNLRKTWIPNNLMEVDPRNICTSQINYSSEADSLQISSKADIVFRIKYHKHKIEQVSAEENIDVSKIAETLREYRMIKSLIIEQSNKKTQIERKIKKPHLEWLASRISQLIGRHYTLSSLRSDLFQEFPEIGYISLSSMSRIMNGNLKVSYKKLGCSNTLADCPNYKEKIVKCLKVISWFKKNNYHIVYVDEFSVNRSTTSMYG